MTTEEEVIAREGAVSNIPPHPFGQFALRCIDLIDHGMVERTWKGRTQKQHRIVLRFWAGETFEGDDGKTLPLWVDAWFTLTLSEAGNLRPFLEEWRGQPFTEEELDGFNVARLVGAELLGQVSHNVTPKRTYANLGSVMRLPKEMPGPGELVGYVRVKDRPPREGDSTEYRDDSGHDPLPF